MHVDKAESHIISFILHIDSSDDAEPWPLTIDDFQGNTHDVVLTSGDLVLYESSKVFHGRPHPFRGSWYTSIFAHFYPPGHNETFDKNKMVYAIPPGWRNDPEHHDQVPLRMYGPSFEEATCPNGWCATQDSIQWTGPAREGYLTAPNGQTFPFHPKPLSCQDTKAKCIEWAKSGECAKNQDYMVVMYPKSCNTCVMAASHDEL